MPPEPANAPRVQFWLVHAVEARFSPCGSPKALIPGAIGTLRPDGPDGRGPSGGRRRSPVGKNRRLWQMPLLVCHRPRDDADQATCERREHEIKAVNVLRVGTKPPTPEVSAAAGSGTNARLSAGNINLHR